MIRQAEGQTEVTLVSPRDGVGWVPLIEALEQLSHEGEREMATKALTRGGT